MQNSMNPMQEFEKEFQRLLNETLFPTDKLMPDFIKFMDIALNTLSIADFSCDKETYLKVLNSRKQFLNDVEYVWNLMDVSFIINALSRVSPEKYGVDFETYLGLLNEFEKMAADWNAIVKDIKLKVADLMKRQAALKNNAPKMKVIPNGKNRKIGNKK